MRRSLSASERVRVQTMSEMRETMNEELAEIIRTLEKANGALARIFKVEEGENCAGCGEPYEGESDCPDCRCNDSCGCTEEEREG